MKYSVIFLSYSLVALLGAVDDKLAIQKKQKRREKENEILQEWQLLRQFNIIRHDGSVDPKFRELVVQIAWMQQEIRRQAEAQRYLFLRARL
ncbi:MAG TPA: hypothetical protein VEK38_00440 [Candidatus Bathyarchaeia archaeon]|nr:hypothetical protein [Candidatus Bathyarchaeia archaeon]